MGGRELLNRKSIYRTALLNMSFETLAVRAFKALRRERLYDILSSGRPFTWNNSRKFELKPPANRPNDPNFS
jgi:hypothetical protein